MEKQLALLDQPQDWKLDKRTRELGLRGVAQARAALKAAAEKEAHETKSNPARQRSAA